ncbi:cytochrome P450 [Mycolicibacterium agri]|uniref:Steroid C26-monooxygenase n=1 Tax=Mycolicibacterium agri TaxID=36811 RepID=A0A2A7MRC2_MYCAG|nr:cytochrome P450 [Mycolicibacterium agri]PEG34119.1 cytochrome P450 [Mycolicibacterium agri]GFG53639.1 cytochrome P450 monooxygenase [Mycolicibacterium agri]
MTTTPETDVYYDPYDVDIAADPWPTYARLREEAPIYYNERYRFWAISRFSDVEAALANWQAFSNSRSDILELVNSDFDMPNGVMMFEDPPVHTMLRGLMSRVFTPRRMAEIEDQIRQFCVNCLDPHVGSDGFDIVAELAAQMPMRVIGMLLGIPESDQVMVRDVNDANLRTKPGAPMKVSNADKIADGSIYADYVDWRAKNPSDDLMTALLTMEFEDENGVTRKLHRSEILHYVQVVAGAGNETTGRLIGWLAKVLAEHPDQRRQVHEDRSLLTRAVDETLRYEPTGPHVARYMLADVELYDTTVPAGSAMLLLFGAANRDPRRYTDPDTFDIHRDNISHLTFGKGVHYCLGANLARLEGRVTLDELLNRWPEWDIDYDTAVRAPTSTVRGWERLRIVFP